MSPSRKKYPVTRIAVLALFAIAAGWYALRAAPLPFIDSWWTPDGPEWHDPWYRRHRIADWLIISGRLQSLTKAEVIQLLGEPPDHGYFGNYDLVYNLGSERGWFGIDSEWLAIRFNSEGLVSEALIVRD